LEGRRYRRAFEPGCSVGVLTEQLADRCDSIEAIDFSSTAVLRARERCAGFPQVSVAVASFEEYLPMPSDLFVFAEIGYYFTAKKLESIASRCLLRLEPSGTLIGCHWLGHSEDHVLSGDAVHEILRRLPGLRLQSSQRFEHYLLDCWEKAFEERP
jgi:predicted TPR repeat methyltransferase